MLLQIMRGLPGSGKSFYIEHFFNKAGSKVSIEVCSADHFHMVDGEYKYVPQNAGIVHAKCFRKAINMCLSKDFDVVFIDNTNIGAYEIAPYVQLANAFEIDYEIVQVERDFKECCESQIHKVPINTMLYMRQRLITESLPPFWKIRLMNPVTFGSKP